MSYLAVRHLHIFVAVLSGVFFFVRGLWMLKGSSLLQRRWVKTVPHIVDTVLLASAITLAVWSGQYPGQQAWLTVKVVLLVVYIVLGMIALKRGGTKSVRSIAFLAAMLTFVFIFTVARTRDPLGMFGMM